MLPNLDGLAHILHQADAVSEYVRRHRAQLDQLAKVASLHEVVAALSGIGSASLQTAVELASSQLALIAAQEIQPTATVLQSVTIAADALIDRDRLLSASIQTALQDVRLPVWHSIPNLLVDIDAARIQMASTFASLVAPFRQMEDLVQSFTSVSRFIEESAYWAKRHRGSPTGAVADAKGLAGD